MAHDAPFDEAANRETRAADLVDLHVHTAASDGVCPPAEAVRLAAQAGLRAVAVTDHDTVAGVAEAVAAGPAAGIEVIPGVEISCEYDDGACHVLGYFIDTADASLLETLDEARSGRDRRNRQILERLNRLGLPLTMDEVTAGPKGTSVTRAHFAKALLARGYFQEWDQVFDRVLGRGKPAYVYRKRVEPERALGVIRGAGGLASLAHPRQLNRSLDATVAFIEHLVGLGLDAVETQTSDHGPSFARTCRGVAQRLGLLETGGTDWHGRADSDIRLGVGTGGVAVRYAVVEAMKARLAERRG